MKLRDSSIGNN